MAKAGEIVENPITGERVIWRRTARDTGGELVECDLYVRPHGFVVTEHVHLSQQESFEVIEGVISFRVNGRELTAGPGEKVVVPPGTRHKFWNAADEPLHVVLEVQPAGTFEPTIETMFGLARDGKTNKKGMPNPLQVAVLAHAADGYAVGIPRPIQTVLLTVLGSLGTRLGYKARYSRYSGEE
jgi:mannose-6-phosphate isomerase-like protein (cupin superfamily)